MYTYTIIIKIKKQNMMSGHPGAPFSGHSLPPTPRLLSSDSEPLVLSVSLPPGRQPSLTSPQLCAWCAVHAGCALVSQRCVHGWFRVWLLRVQSPCLCILAQCSWLMFKSEHHCGAMCAWTLRSEVGQFQKGLHPCRYQASHCSMSCWYLIL